MPADRMKKRALSDSGSKSKRGSTRLFLAVCLIVSAAALLGYRVYSTLRKEKPSRLYISADVSLGPPAPPPSSDLNSLRDRLKRLAESSAEISGSPDDALKLLDFAREAYRAGDNLSARTAFQRVIRKWRPEDAAIYEALASCEFQLGLLTDAERAFKTSIMMAPRELAGYAGLIRLYDFARRPADADRILDQAAEKIPSADVKARLEISRLFDDHQDSQTAINVAKDAAAASPNDPAPNVAIANLLLKLELFPEAEALLKQFDRKSPELSQVHRLKGALYAARANPKRDAVKAEHHYLRALELDDFNVRALTGLAGLLMEQGKYKPAALVTNRLLELDPRNHASRGQLALSLSRAGSENAAASQRDIARAGKEWEDKAAFLRGQRDARPADPARRLALARHLEAGGMHTDAFVEMQAAWILSGRSEPYTRALSAFYTNVGARPTQFIELKTLAQWTEPDNNNASLTRTPHRRITNMRGRFLFNASESTWLHREAHLFALLLAPDR